MRRSPGSWAATGAAVSFWVVDMGGGGGGRGPVRRYRRGSRLRSQASGSRIPPPRAGVRDENARAPSQSMRRAKRSASAGRVCTRRSARRSSVVVLMMVLTRGAFPARTNAEDANVEAAREGSREHAMHGCSRRPCPALNAPLRSRRVRFGDQRPVTTQRKRPHAREGCAPGGPGTRRTAVRHPVRRDDAGAGRRGPGCVGHGGIVPYAARSPVRRLGAEHARNAGTKRMRDEAVREIQPPPPPRSPRPSRGWMLGYPHRTASARPRPLDDDRLSRADRNDGYR